MTGGVRANVEARDEAAWGEEKREERARVVSQSSVRLSTAARTSPASTGIARQFKTGFAERCGTPDWNEMRLPSKTVCRTLRTF
jgi:hypothetical protein